MPTFRPKSEPVASRCWLFHRWGMWEQYELTAKWKELASDPPQLSPLSFVTDYKLNIPVIDCEETTVRQKRACLNCGFVQDRLVRD